MLICGSLNVSPDVARIPLVQYFTAIDACSEQRPYQGIGLFGDWEMGHSTPRKRILFIVWSFSLGGGAEKILSYILNAIDSDFTIDLLEVEHFDVSWECLPVDVTVLPPIYDHSKKGLRYRLLDGAKRGLCLALPGVFRRLFRRTAGYDCVIAFNYLLPALLVFPHENSIMWNHGSIEDLKSNSLWRKREGRALDSANAIVAISQRTKESIQDVFPDLEQDIELIYNGFDVEEIRRKADQPEVFQIEDDSILWIGRLDDNKDPLMALCIFSKVIDRSPGTHLYFVGQGDLRQEVEETAHNLGLSDRVHFLGYQPNPYPLIRSSHCVLSTSKQEGFPTVLMEALALGKPFVCSDVAGSEEISAGGTYGYVYEDEDDAVEAVCDYMNNPITEDQTRAMEEHAESFSLERQKASIIKLINDVADSKR